MTNNEELIMQLTEKADSAICCGVIALVVAVIALMVLFLYMIKKGDL